MSLNLLDSFDKKGVSYGLLTKSADVIDGDYASKYFVVSELGQQFSAGRNALSLNGSVLLKPGSEIYIECLDSKGDPLFVEMALSTNVAARTYPYKEATAFVFSVHVYNDTADGVGRLILYGTTSDNKTVKWIRNITIDKTIQNTSKIRFYNRPSLEIDSVLVPVLSNAVAADLKRTITTNATVHGLAVTPSKDTNLATVNRRNIDVNYQIVIDSPVITDVTPDYNAVNAQMVDAVVNISPYNIQAPLSSLSITPIPTTQSFLISKVLNNKTFNIIDPYFYKDGYGNNVVTNINAALATVSYPYISYNNATASYQQTNLNGNLVTVYQSYADIIYRNIRTFSGYLARHKVYRRSLLSNADYAIIADEPLFVNEMLRDNLTQNKFYEMLGKFYNQDHINRYWFTSSNNIQLVHSPSKYIDSVFISSSTYNSLIGDDYFIVKNDSISGNRNAEYVPFNATEFNLTSGSSYDSNFMELKSNVQYLIQMSSIILKDENETEAKLDIYFTSSLADAAKDYNYSNKHGIRIGTLSAEKVGSKQDFSNIVFYYTPPEDLYGTLVIVPRKCQAYLKDISFRVYGDDGFSPDLFISRIPWTVNTANETFQIKAELFDINQNLVYSDLRVVQNFDPSGSSLVPYIPGGSIFEPGTNDAFISGNLVVSKSIESQYGSLLIDRGDIVVTQGSIYVPEIGDQPRDRFLSASRFLSVRGDNPNVGELVSTAIVDLGHDDQYLFVVTGSLGISSVDHSTGTPNPNPVGRRQSIASIYSTEYGGRIFYSGGTKQEERPTGY